MIDFSPLHDFSEVHFYFLRHGKSEGNLKELVQGRLDFPLSEEGKEQAILTGKWFTDKRIVAVFTTPLQRGQQTAQILTKAGNLPFPEVLPSLIEMDPGIFTGLTLEEAKQKFPQIYAQFLQKSWEAVAGSEKIVQLKERAIQVWNTLIQRILEEKQKGKPPLPQNTDRPLGVVAVTHSGFLQWILKVTLESSSWFPLFPMGDCGIYQLTLHHTVTRWAKLNFQVPGVQGSR
ncbi:MAG: histidine phosphatase family protein [Spirochaetales bacterium]